jgi:hypothetical protein
VNQFRQLAAIAAAALLLAAAPACSPAYAAPQSAALEVIDQSVSSLDGAAIEALRASPAAGRLLNSSGVYSQGLQLVQADVPTLSTGEKDTGYDFSTGDIILDAWIVVSTLEATASTKTIDVGLLSSESGGDADGFIDGASTAAAATVKTGATIGSAAAGATKYCSTTTQGALLMDFAAGVDAGGVNADSGICSPKEHVITSTAKSLTYTLGSTHSEVRAKIYVLLWRKPV